MRYLFLTALIAASIATAAEAAFMPDLSVTKRSPSVVPKHPPKHRMEPPPLEDILGTHPDPSPEARKCSKRFGRGGWILSSKGFKLHCRELPAGPDSKGKGGIREKPDPSVVARMCSKTAGMTGGNDWSLTSRSSSGGYELECRITPRAPDHK